MVKKKKTSERLRVNKYYERNKEWKKGKHHILTFARQQFERRLKNALARAVFFQVTSRGQIDHEVDLGPWYGSSCKDCMSLPVRCVVDSSGLY